MKNIFLITVFGVILAISTNINSVFGMNLFLREQHQENDSSLNFTIALAEQQNSNIKDNIFIDLIFENVGDQNIKIFDCFEPIPIFFSLEIRKSDGTYLQLPGAGKITFDHSIFEYITIEPGNSYHHLLNLSNEIKSYGEFSLNEKYEIQIIYHNQYGENCLKGWYESNEIELNIIK